MTWFLPCLIGTAVTATVMIFFKTHHLVVFVAAAFAPMIQAIGGNACVILICSRALENTVTPGRLVFAFGTAMFPAIMAATTLGLFLPFLFRRIGIDPAINSGPPVTTANYSISAAI